MLADLLLKHVCRFVSTAFAQLLRKVLKALLCLLRLLVGLLMFFRVAAVR